MLFEEDIILAYTDNDTEAGNALSNIEFPKPMPIARYTTQVSSSGEVSDREHGYWKKYDEEIYECSECGYEWYLTNLASHPRDNNAFYCPCCGVEMDLEVSKEK